MPVGHTSVLCLWDTSASCACGTHECPVSVGHTSVLCLWDTSMSCACGTHHCPVSVGHITVLFCTVMKAVRGRKIKERFSPPRTDVSGSASLQQSMRELGRVLHCWSASFVPLTAMDGVCFAQIMLHSYVIQTWWLLCIV